MPLILCTREERPVLSHGMVLCTQEQADDYLMHYRVGGEKNGRRRWQDESGRLTPEGYKHYAEMYGWNKRLRKAEKLQNKADAAKARADKALEKSDRITVRANKFYNKNNVRLKRVQIQRDEDYARKALAAREAQRTATSYADKLQRKEDREAKYRNEDGSLNDKGIAKYTVAQQHKGDPRKMNFLGKLKFGREYSKMYDEQEARQMREAKDEADAVVHDTLNKVHELKYGTKDSRNAIDGLKYAIGTFEKENLVRPDTLEYAKEQYAKLRTDELADLGTFADGLDKYGSMSSKEKAETGSRLLDELSSTYKSDFGAPNYRSGDQEYLNLTDKLRGWLVDTVYEKCGSINAGWYKPGTNAEKANKKADESYKKLSAREDQIKKETGLTSPKDRDRLQNLLKKDSTWKQLNVDWNQDLDDVAGAILKDLGFPDTPTYRSLINMYGWYD